MRNEGSFRSCSFAELLPGLLAGALFIAGCASHHSPGADSGPPKSTQTKPVITPDFRPTGEVEMVDAPARFAVIRYDPAYVPKNGQALNVYRAGVKVGELKVTGPQKDNNTVADITAGDVQVRDETRQN